MKVSGGEGAGPVWQTLKGLSSRDASCGSPTSLGPQQEQRGLQSSNTAAERLARRDSCPLDATSSSSSRPLKEVTLPHLILPEGDRSPVLYNGSVATPVSAPPTTASGDDGGRTHWGPPSSSTTSTSLSNTNLALHKSAVATPNNMLLSNNNINATSPKDEMPEADIPEAETPSVFRHLILVVLVLHIGSLTITLTTTTCPAHQRLCVLERRVFAQAVDRLRSLS